MNTDPAIDVATTLADELPANDLTALAEAAGRGTEGIRALAARATSPILRRACALAIDSLRSHTVDYLAGALAASAATVENMRARQRLDIVWTGPESRVNTSRLTAATVISLLDSARDEILIVSYAINNRAEIHHALQRAAKRGVVITIVLERRDDNPGFRQQRPPFPGVPARFLAWPAAQRERYASLHAKIIVIDAAAALVGSANITNSAMEANLECGVLINGGSQPRTICDHIFSLAAQGILVDI